MRFSEGLSEQKIKNSKGPHFTLVTCNSHDLTDKPEAGGTLFFFFFYCTRYLLSVCLLMRTVVQEMQMRCTLYLSLRPSSKEI